MGELRRRCKTCGESYAENVIFCPRDGAALSARTRDAGEDPYLGQIVAGQFRIETLIGEGAVGSVYRAHQLEIERTVALKIMHRELAGNETLRSRFRREARVVGALDHPNVVHVLTFGEVEPDGPPFIAFEFLDGLSLRSALAAVGTLPGARAAHLLLQIADAVGAAHERGIVHRDLKPENVMLVTRGDDADFVKVLDFGVARVEHGDPSIATHAGAIFGSARYVSPESAAGGEATQASDVYALATIYYECLAGAPPFDGENPVQILLQHQTGVVPPLGSPVPPEVAAFIARNLAKDPAARAENARVFARELITLEGALGAHSATRMADALAASSRTRRGHAVAPALAAKPVSAPAPRAEIARTELHGGALPSTLARSGALGRAVVVLVCFALGVGAALGIAAKLGAFAEKNGAVTSHAGSNGAP